MKILYSTLLTAAVLASASAAAEPAPAGVTITRLGVSTTTFSCGAGNTGGCHYLILTSLCQEQMLDSSTKERTCKYKEAVPPFTLMPGEKKTVGNLPSDYLYRMKTGTAPTVDDVLKSPMSH
jgi:hypothetical protein